MKVLKTNNVRQQKFSSLIHVALVEVLRKAKRLDKLLLESPVTITRVVASADLKFARCYFIPFNTNITISDLEKSLNRSKNSIRSAITEKIQMKYSPDLLFYYDETFENATNLDLLLKQINTDIKTD
jgi:ribosome-binding factor A